MERFVYVCNENEFVKFIESMGKDILLSGDVFHNELVFIINKKELHKYSDKLFSNTENGSKGSIEDLIDEINSKLPNTTEFTDKPVYVSVHPGGTSRIEITKKLNTINKELSKNEVTNHNIRFTYHGSQNPKATNFFNKAHPNKNDLIDLSKAIKVFLNFDDAKAIFDNFKLRLDVLATLVKELQQENESIATKDDLFEKVFPKLNEEVLNDLKEKIENYGNQLLLYNIMDEKVRRKIFEVYEKFSKNEINTQIFNSLKELQEKNQ